MLTEILHCRLPLNTLHKSERDRGYRLKEEAMLLHDAGIRKERERGSYDLTTELIQWRLRGRRATPFGAAGEQRTARGAIM